MTCWADLKLFEALKAKIHARRNPTSTLALTNIRNEHTGERANLPTVLYSIDQHALIVVIVVRIEGKHALLELGQLGLTRRLDPVEVRQKAFDALYFLHHRTPHRPSERPEHTRQ